MSSDTHVHHPSLVAVAAVLALALPACAGSDVRPEPATLILRGGHVVTVDASRPEVEAVAVRGDRIVATGSNEQIDTYLGADTEVIDLEGRLAIPGFIEGHGHLMGIGRARMQLQLGAATSWEAIVAQVADAVANAAPGAWIVGRGWHQSKWDQAPEPMVRGFQTHAALSAVSPDNPVLLTHASGHAAIVNARAMQLAGIGAETPSPDGGEVIKDAGGRPTGILLERAQGLAGRALAAARDSMPEQERQAESRRALALAFEELQSKGITSFHDAGVDPSTVAMYERALADGELGVRLYVMIRASLGEMDELLPRIRTVGLGDDRLTVRAIKMVSDGALGPRGAWLLEPYDDDPGSVGFNTTPMTDIRAVADLALVHGFQLCVHAIGDRANHETLDVFEAAYAAAPERAADARFRVEHAQLLLPEEVPRFAAGGFIASMQGVHATSDGPWTPERIGPARTAERAYRFRDLIDAGVVVMNGTDAPVEDVDPIPSFYAATTLRMNNGEVLNPDQQMTRLEALRSYTLDAAFGAFEEELKGSITPGKLADIVVLTENIMTVSEDRILQARVAMTVIGGDVVYRRQ